MHGNNLLTNSRTLGVMLALCLLSSSILAQQRMTLEKIEFVGQKRIPISQLTSLSELKIGQVVDQATFDEAAAKLLQSGLFRKLGYRVRSANGRVTVTFQVEESAMNLPVRFENFVWFNEEELLAAIRNEVQFFNGAAPAAGETLDKITAALQHLLNQRNIKGTVEALPMITGGKPEMIFTVKGAKAPVCSLHFPGAKAISESELIKASQPILKSDYSEKDIAGFVPAKLIPLYRHLGYLRVEFQKPTAVFQNSAQCPSGVVVTIPVEEGPALSWGRSEWNGNEKLTVDELAAALNMNPGEVADGLKIDKGLKEVRLAYSRKGYLTAEVKDSFEVEPSSAQVNYRLFITEGPRYFMGALIVNGVAPAEAEQLKTKWKLGSNSVFDESYLEEFRQTVLPAFIRDVAPRSRTGTRLKAEIATRPDAQKRSVDVVITFS